MENTKPFYDLCVHDNIKKDFRNFIRKYAEFGYKTIAIDYVLNLITEDNQNVAKQKKGSKKSDIELQPPFNSENFLKMHDCQDLDIQVLSRLTIICTEKDKLFRIMKMENFRKYHIFAILPKSYEVFTCACDNLDVDIITFDPLDVKGIKLNPIIDQTSRRNIISRSHVYHQMGRSRNIIISSGCNTVLTLRGPYDIINLGLVFGLSEQQSKQAITSACAKVIRHALSRRIGKAIVFISHIENDKNEEVMEIESDDSVEPTTKKLKT